MNVWRALQGGGVCHWNRRRRSSLPPLLSAVHATHGLVPAATLLRWYSRDPRQLLVGLGDRSSETARFEVREAAVDLGLRCGVCANT